jgi:hypothetical protein
MLSSIHLLFWPSCVPSLDPVPRRSLCRDSRQAELKDTPPVQDREPMAEAWIQEIESLAAM